MPNIYICTMRFMTEVHQNIAVISRWLDSDDIYSLLRPFSSVWGRGKCY